MKFKVIRFCYKKRKSNCEEWVREMKDMKSKIDTRGGLVAAIEADTNQQQYPSCNTEIVRSDARTIFEKWLSDSQVR